MATDLNRPVNPGYSLQSIVPSVPQSLRGTDPEQDHPQEDFIKLMVAQLQNQDPEKPADGTALISQLTTMNAAFATTRMSYLAEQNAGIQSSAALLGRMVQLKDPATGAAVNGKVSTVDYSGSKPMVVVNGHAFPLTAVDRVDV